jgi:hypothetical protein
VDKLKVETVARKEDFAKIMQYLLSTAKEAIPNQLKTKNLQRKEVINLALVTDEVQLRRLARTKAIFIPESFRKNTRRFLNKSYQITRNRLV